MAERPIVADQLLFIFGIGFCVIILYTLIKLAIFKLRHWK